MNSKKRLFDRIEKLNLSTKKVVVLASTYEINSTAKFLTNSISEIQKEQLKDSDLTLLAVLFVLVETLGFLTAIVVSYILISQFIQIDFIHTRSLIWLSLSIFILLVFWGLRLPKLIFYLKNRTLTISTNLYYRKLNSDQLSIKLLNHVFDFDEKFKSPFFFCNQIIGRLTSYTRRTKRNGLKKIKQNLSKKGFLSKKDSKILLDLVANTFKRKISTNNNLKIAINFIKFYSIYNPNVIIRVTDDFYKSIYSFEKVSAEDDFTLKESAKYSEGLGRNLANLKHYLIQLVEANIYLVADKVTFDSSLADIADRDSFFSSIFHEIFFDSSSFEKIVYSKKWHSNYQRIRDCIIVLKEFSQELKDEKCRKRLDYLLAWCADIYLGSDKELEHNHKLASINRVNREVIQIYHYLNKRKIFSSINPFKIDIYESIIFLIIGRNNSELSQVKIDFEVILSKIIHHEFTIYIVNKDEDAFSFYDDDSILFYLSPRIAEEVVLISKRGVDSAKNRESIIEKIFETNTPVRIKRELVEDSPYVKKVKSLLKEKLKISVNECINYFLKIISTHSYMYDDLIQLQIRNKHLLSDYNKGIVDYPTFLIESNKITNSTLFLINEVEVFNIKEKAAANNG